MRTTMGDRPRSLLANVALACGLVIPLLAGASVAQPRARADPSCEAKHLFDDLERAAGALERQGGRREHSHQFTEAVQLVRPGLSLTAIVCDAVFLTPQVAPAYDADARKLTFYLREADWPLIWEVTLVGTETRRQARHRGGPFVTLTFRKEEVDAWLVRANELFDVPFSISMMPEDAERHAGKLRLRIVGDLVSPFVLRETDEIQPTPASPAERRIDARRLVIAPKRVMLFSTATNEIVAEVPLVLCPHADRPSYRPACEMPEIEVTP
ncbi:MAG TPA: hypothetical protein VEA41_04565 [Salinarimonas sp.]|nr:hypothetical protein [Salinarimonas sp.]